MQSSKCEIFFIIVERDEINFMRFWDRRSPLHCIEFPIVEQSIGRFIQFEDSAGNVGGRFFHLRIFYRYIIYFAYTSL